MEDIAKSLQQPEYLHVLLNHLPLTGLVVALILLVTAIIANSRGGMYLALGAVVILSLSVWPVAYFGEAGYDRVLSMADDAGGLYLKHHHELAERWIFIYYVTAAVAVGAMIVGSRKKKWLRLLAIIAASFTAASLYFGAIIADVGGKIRHREFRHGPPPDQSPEATSSIATSKIG